MILEQPRQLEVRRIGDLNEGLTAGISEESLPFVFELVSKQLYSNPIGSLIREYTSNCFDSHIEANVEDPVIVRQVHSIEEGYSIEFQDVGVGLSPERVQNIFMNYFSSTKRGSNLQIGGFGIGSKTALAYADMFYITTVFDSLQYEYLFHKGETKPTLESLHGYEEYIYTESTIKTDEITGEECIEQTEVTQRVPIGVSTQNRNGTIIRVNIERQDLEKFKEELRFQLAYFDNVYFSNWGISNDYDIYEGEYFKFRSDIPQNTGTYYITKGTEIHLCIGKVRYPIDFTKVSVLKEYKNIPIAVKFEIGELQITPSRETLRYTPETIILIQERIKLAAEEVVKLFYDQNPVVESLGEYVALMNNKPKITFDKSKGHILYLWAESKVEKNFKFKPLEGINIKKVPKSLFFMWEHFASITSSGIRVISRGDTSVTNEFVLDKNYIIHGKDDRSSTYTDMKISMEDYPSGVPILRKKPLDFDYISEKLGIKNSKIVGKAKIIREYLKVTDHLILNGKKKYSDLRATDEWIAAYKKSIKESSAAYIRKKNKKVFVRDASRSFAGIELSTEELNRRTGILVYGYKEDQDVLKDIYNTVVFNKQSIRSVHDKSKAFMVIQVAKSSEKDIIPDVRFDRNGKMIPSKTIYWRDFLKTKFFRKIETAYYIREILEGLHISVIQTRIKLLYRFEEDYQAVVSSHLECSRNFLVDDKYLSGNYIQDMLKPLNKFESKHLIELPLLIQEIGTGRGYINDKLLKEAVEYLKFKGFKLHKKLYLKDQRQLQYEANLKKILKQFQEPAQLLLTYTLNQTKNVNESNNREENSSEESRTY